MSTNEAIVNFEPSECLWDAVDVAKFLKTSRSWVYGRAEAGTLPCLRIGGLLRFEPEQIRAWMRGMASNTTVIALQKC